LYERGVLELRDVEERKDLCASGIVCALERADAVGRGASSVQCATYRIGVTAGVDEVVSLLCCAGQELVARLACRLGHAAETLDFSAVHGGAAACSFEVGGYTSRKRL